MKEEGAKEGVYDSALACLSIVARLQGLPADPDQLRHRFPCAAAGFARHDLLGIARSLGLKARNYHPGLARLANARLPAIAVHRDGHYFIIARVEADKA